MILKVSLLGNRRLLDELIFPVILKQKHRLLKRLSIHQDLKGSVLLLTGKALEKKIIFD